MTTKVRALNIEEYNPKIKKIIKNITKVAFPMALQSMLISLVGLIDNFFVGQLNNATYVAAGLNAISNLIFIVSTIVLSFIAGIGVYFAQASGTSNKGLQQELFRIKFIWVLVLSSILLFSLYMSLNSLSGFWISEGVDRYRAINAAYDYGSIVIPSLFLDYLIITIASSFRETKKTWITLVVAFIAIVINSSLNYPFMFTFGWGIKGSVYATLIARFSEIFIWIVFIWKKKPIFIPNILTIFNVSFKKIFAIFPKSFWWMLSRLLVAFAFSLQILFMSSISISAGAALNAAGAIAQLALAFSGGFATAMSIIIMHKIGIHNQINHNYVMKLSIISIIFGILIGVFLAAFSPLVFLVYPKYTHYTNLQSMYMLWSISSTMFIGLWGAVYIACLKGAGFAKSLTVLEGLYSWAIILPITVLLVSIPNSIDFGFIYWIVGSSLLFKPIILYIFYKKKKNEMQFKLLDSVV